MFGLSPFYLYFVVGSLAVTALVVLAHSVCLDDVVCLFYCLLVVDSVVCWFNSWQLVCRFICAGPLDNVGSC